MAPQPMLSKRPGEIVVFDPHQCGSFWRSAFWRVRCMASFPDGASVFADHLLDCALDLLRRSDDPIFVYKCILRYSVPERETLAPDVLS